MLRSGCRCRDCRSSAAGNQRGSFSIHGFRFNDFAVLVRNNYDGVALLDKVVTALNHNDETAAWLHQRLKTAPEQTFGIRLTLALLDSAAPIRKIKGYSNTARRDPAPLIAFSENNAKEFVQLSPAAASVVRTLLDRYLKPPAIDPDKTLGPLQLPPPSLR